MPYAQVLSSAFVASTSGGTFADSLAACSGDSLSVANFGQGGARVLEAWAIDSLHVGEIQVIYTRPESTHDQSHGWRSQIQAAAFGTLGSVQQVSILGGKMTLNLFRSDTPTIQATSTAGDCVIYSWVTEYDDLPGASASFVTPDFVNAHHKSRVGILNSAQANTGTAGQWGTSRAFNADDNRLHANTWYAIQGINVRTGVHAVSLIGPDWGGQRIGIPAGSIQIESSSWFLDQALKWGKPLIPCFNSNNAGNVLVQVQNGATSTTPQIDFQLVELDLPSTWNASHGTV